MPNAQNLVGRLGLRAFYLAGLTRGEHTLSASARRLKQSSREPLSQPRFPLESESTSWVHLQMILSPLSTFNHLERAPGITRTLATCEATYIAQCRKRFPFSDGAVSTENVN